MKEELRKADSNYKPIPSFKAWSGCSVDEFKWKKYCEKLQKNDDPNTLRKAFDIVSRTAAIQTGAIEKLYDADRGFTFAVATQASMWENAFLEKEQNARNLIEDQINTYDYILDFATKKVDIAETWIREIHRQICKSQEHYIVYTPTEAKQQLLEKGKYKTFPNHVKKQNSEIHSYCPVDLVGSEMQKLCKELRSKEFANAHPVLQASYAHYAITVIHPFSDGNGRVARALGSVYTYRAERIPLLILTENRDQYFTCLEQADEGNYQPFIDFVLLRSLDAFQLVGESLNAASSPSFEETSSALRDLYVTEGGYTHSIVDQAGKDLFNLFVNGFAKLRDSIKDDKQFKIQPSTSGINCKLVKDTNRVPIDLRNNYLTVNFVSSPPADSTVQIGFSVEVPKNCEKEDEIIINDTRGSEVFIARITELYPKHLDSLLIRLDICLNKLAGEAMKKLIGTSTQSLKAKGY